MMWIGLLKLILSIGSRLIAYVDKKQLLDAGAAKAAKGNLEQAIEDIRRADAARSAVDYNADELQDDKYNRDNTK